MSTTQIAEMICSGEQAYRTLVETVTDRLQIRQSSILLLDHKTIIVPAVSGEAFHETYLHMLVSKCSLLFPLRSPDLAHGLAISLPLSYRPLRYMMSRPLQRRDRER